MINQLLKFGKTPTDYTDTNLKKRQLNRDSDKKNNI